jgi:MFS family permease
LIAVLLVILAFNYMDRVVLGLVLQDIKLELRLSDSQLGFLSGIAFALFYSVMGVPIARWADRGNRATIISLTVAAWSILVVLSGLAASFVQLLLIRVGIGVGEAGCVPPAHSLIADYFNRSERPRALAIYTLGQPLSFVIGYFLGGWLNQFYGWRTTFILLGSPGLVLAVIVWFTLREPREARLALTPDAGLASSLRTGPPAAHSSSSIPSLKDVFVTLWANKTFRHLAFCLSIIYFVGFGILQWQPTFFVRSYGLKSGEIGTWFAVSYGFGGMLGSYVGGEWAARRAAHNESLQLRAAACAIAGFGALSILTYLAPNKYVAFLLMGLGSMTLNAVNGPLFGTIQTLIPERMRAMAIAVVYFFANLIGMGLGPWAVGALSDAFRPWAGEESLRYALLLLAPIGYFWGAWHSWCGSSNVARDLPVSNASEAPLYVTNS